MFSCSFAKHNSIVASN